MRILWTDEALVDLVEIFAYYYLKASPRVAEAVEKRIVGEIESLPVNQRAILTMCQR